MQWSLVTESRVVGVSLDWLTVGESVLHRTAVAQRRCSSVTLHSFGALPRAVRADQPAVVGDRLVRSQQLREECAAIACLLRRLLDEKLRVGIHHLSYRSAFRCLQLEVLVFLACGRGEARGGDPEVIITHVPAPDRAVVVESDDGSLPVQCQPVAVDRDAHLLGVIIAHRRHE